VFAPRFELHSFESLRGAARIDLIRMLVKVLIVADRLHLQAHPTTPKLYAAGIRYLREGPDSENYQNIPRTLELKTGDCEDLAAWRIAELQEEGEDVHLVIREYDEPQDETDYHLLVGRADGSVEDPSAILGMR
jgi:hypothetical protein